MDETGKINLTWGINPRDLDLHLSIEADSGTDEISYSSKGSLEREPWSELDNDDTNGSGSETITIGRWMQGKYQCAIHNFSKEILLAGCGARVVFSCGQETREFLCPNEGSGQWWLVFSLDGHTGRIEAINRIVDKWP